MAKQHVEEKIQWHPPFCSATELEFREDADILEFIPELPLSKKPLNVDLFIIKKTDNRVLQNDIGKLFRKDNICEYKGPGDYISIDDFYKAIAYACLYKSLGKEVDARPASQITVSLIQETHPKLLFKTLISYGASISSTYPGIYYIRGNYPFPMQMIVTKELEKFNHSPLRVLTKNVDKEDVRQLLKIANQLVTQRDKNNFKSVVNASSSANVTTYDDIKKEDETMAGIIEMAERKGFLEGEAHGEARGEARGKEKERTNTATNMIKDGLPASMIQKYTTLTMDKLQEIAKSLNTTLVL
ncbi:hypothetical protein [Phascolarctobacterium sp.]|uniref:hypothetical protein n=2 Tax=Phascolarctobacterium sp. TaxID=2049039 RepID=UPI00386C1D2D